MNVSGDGDDLMGVAELLGSQPSREKHVQVDVVELHDTQPAIEHHVQVDVAELLDTQPAHEQHVVQQHVSRSHPIIEGRKSMDHMRTKLETSVARPFSIIKPIGAEGDVTLKEINQRIRTLQPLTPKPEIENLSSNPNSAFSGKPVVSKVKVHPEGGKELHDTQPPANEHDAQFDVAELQDTKPEHGHVQVDVADLLDTKPANEHVKDQPRPLLVYSRRKRMTTALHDTQPANEHDVQVDVAELQNTQPANEHDVQLDVAELQNTLTANEHVQVDAAELRYIQPANEHNVQVDVAELQNTQPAHELVQVDIADLQDTQPEHEQLVVQQHVIQSHPKHCLQRKYMDQVPTEMATSGAHPFDFNKPNSAEGDVTFEETNQRIQTPPSLNAEQQIEDPSSYPTSAFSGKPIATKVKIITKGEGSVSVTRTKG